MMWTPLFPSAVASRPSGFTSPFAVAHKIMSSLHLSPRRRASYPRQARARPRKATAEPRLFFLILDFRSALYSWAPYAFGRLSLHDMKLSWMKETRTGTGTVVRRIELLTERGIQRPAARRNFSNSLQPLSTRAKRLTSPHKKHDQGRRTKRPEQNGGCRRQFADSSPS